MKARRKGLSVGLIAALLISTGAAHGQDGERSFAMGITFWPAVDSSTTSTKDRLQRISENSEVVQVLIPWCPGGALESYKWLDTVARETDRLGIALDWLGDDRNGVRCREEQPWSFGDDAAARRFSAQAVEFVERYQPEYLLLGVEVDYYAVASPADFPNFLGTYIRTRDSVKSIAPETLVGASFQYSHSILVSDSSSTLFAVMVDIFKNISDLVGVSIYPFQRGMAPEDFDADYLTYLREIELPVAIVETGWPGSGKAQEQYVRQLLQASDDIGARLVVWTSATDVPARYLRPGTPSWAADIGLWNLGGVPKPSLSVWQSWLARSWSARP